MAEKREKEVPKAIREWVKREREADRLVYLRKDGNVGSVARKGAKKSGKNRKR